MVGVSRGRCAGTGSRSHPPTSANRLEGWLACCWECAGRKETQSFTSAIGCGRWSHVVNRRDRYDVFFEPTGEITGTKGKAEWEVKSRELLMKWHDPNAPGGMWVDHVQLNENSASYEGVNQNGISIRGQKN